MKKLLVILSIIFIEACSDGDIGGYTESIIKGAKASDASSANEEDKPTSLNKYTSPLDDDLLGFDEDELREKLLNSYPRPKAEGNPEPESSSSSSTNSSSSSYKYIGEFAMPQNPYDGEVKDYHWKETVPYFTEDPTYKYGFDQDPEQKDPITYISVEKNENASFMFHAPSNKAYNKFCIVHENENKSFDYVNVLTDGQTNKIAPKDFGTGKAFKIIGYKSNAHAKTCPKQKSASFAQIIKVIPYEMKTKNITYVEINGENCSTPSPSTATSSSSFSTTATSSSSFNEEKCKNGFSEECVEHYFNKIFGQAVVNVKIHKESECEYTSKIPNNLIENDLLVYNLTRPIGLNTTFNTLKHAASEKSENNGMNGSNKEIIYEDPSWHIVYAINKVKKQWELKRCAQDAMKKHSRNFLYYCQQYNFDPNEDPPGTQYYYKSDKHGSTEAYIKVAHYNNGNDAFLYRLYLKDGTRITIDDIDESSILYTDNGNPLVFVSKPVMTADESREAFGAAGYSTGLAGFGGNMHEDYLPYGSIVFAPKQYGVRTYYVLMHELGHSFGLTDVVLSDIYEYTEQPLSSSSSTATSSSSPYTFYATYGSKETNLMAWQTPSGKKLRYRPIQAVCTGGQNVFLAKKIENNKEYTDGEKYGIIELPIKYSDGTFDNINNILIYDNNKEHFGYEDNQWDCIRDCLDPQKEKQFATPARKIYWYNGIKKQTYSFTDIDYCNNFKTELTTYGGKNVYMSKEEFECKVTNYWNHIILNRSSSSNSSSNCTPTN